MSVALGVAAYLVVYFAIGWKLAMRDLPRAWAKAREDWSMERYAREHVRESAIFVTLFWPVVLPARALAQAVDKVAVRADPKALQQQIEERDRYIAQLEREVGIGDRLTPRAAERAHRAPKGEP